MNGKKIVEWKTDYFEMSNAPVMSLRDANRPGVAIDSSKTKFDNISVREVTGTGKILR
jgi:hypothetical protein